jgi:pimeloyl-ACP methyl ester carboxylesterase
MLRIAARLSIIALLLYVAACIALYVFQRSLIYFPQPRSVGNSSDLLILKTAGADLVVTVRRHIGPKALIYFGGNAEDVSYNLRAFANAFPDHAIYLLHYRGYGGSTGKPTEAALHADARALFDKVRAEHTEIAIVGRSLGSGVALRLASERAAARLVLVTPYSSLQEIAAQQYPYFPVRWLLTDKFESWRFAPAIRVPTLILRAEHDQLIPRASTEHLYASFATGLASMVVVSDTDHNSISDSPQYIEAMRAFL